MSSPRSAEKIRKTKETEIVLKLDLDNYFEGELDSGNPREHSGNAPGHEHVSHGAIDGANENEGKERLEDRGSTLPRFVLAENLEDLVRQGPQAGGDHPGNGGPGR